MKWFFEDPHVCDALKREAIEWLYPPTPFRKFGHHKGPGGGVSCVNWVKAMMEAVHVVRPDEFLFDETDADYSSANTMRRIFKYLIGKGTLNDGSIDPQSIRLAEIFARIPIQRAIRAHHDQRQRVGKYIRKKGRAVNLPVSLFMPGDILMMRNGGQFHLPVIIEGRHFASAIPFHGVREGNLHDVTYSFYVAGLFRARARSSQCS